MNKKIILSVFLGLLASASALVASLFMLQQIQGVTHLPDRMDQLEYAFQNIDNTIDIGPELSDLAGTVQSIGNDLNELQQQVGQLEANQQKAPTSIVNELEEKKNEQENKQKEDKKENPLSGNIKNQKPTAEKPEFTTNARLNFRTGAGLKAGIIKTFPVGAKLTYLNEETQKDGYTWLKVKDSTGKTGWVAQKYTSSN